LMEEGYIVRERDESDARSYVIRLTPKGREVEGAMRSVSEVVQDVLLKGLSEDEACRAREMLKRMAVNVIDHVEGRE
jgi:DNA-binding MarR family transcriptional regulator